MPKIIRSFTRGVRNGASEASVDVFDMKEAGDPKGTVKVVATVNGHVHEHFVTIGAPNEPLPDTYDQARFDADLEKAQDHAVAMADSYDRVERLISGIQR